MAYDFQVTFDCSRPHALAEWWADALGWSVEPTDGAFVRRMVEEGKAEESDTMEWRGELVWRVGSAIISPELPGRRLLFQEVPEKKSVKNRIHLDVRVGSERIEEESARLIKKGATELYRGSQGPFRWITLADPEGNELCLT
ncbi:VOC family protein [Pseudonocardia spinosispora]|uniref:VOC family protein n=1 Tax=Pseudonocardia spinosispora TaxID=103441 RepID=UPI00048C916A|nr:VOC family protein [Pseudonocardia spinosispora]